VMQEKGFKVAPVKAAVAFEDLEKIDIRIGTILAVEDLPGSKRLVKLTVSFGDHQRLILAGMKEEREHVKEMEGKQALFVVNLAPRRMLGQISAGMLFDIGYADGLTPVLAIPESKVPDGARAG
jgi:tRNA-binding protein